MEVWDDKRVKIRRWSTAACVLIIHLMTADFDTWGWWAIQPFNIKNVVLSLFFLVFILFFEKELKNGNVPDGWFAARSLGVKFMPYGFTFLFVWFSVYLILLKLGIHLDDIPTLWLGFKP